MFRKFRTLLTPLVLAVCAIGVLPPSGFGLCVDADGHWVIETDLAPGAMCCISGEDDETCAVDACDACIDVALAASSALRSPDAGFGDAPLVALAIELPDLRPHACAIPLALAPAIAVVSPQARHTVPLRI